MHNAEGYGKLAELSNAMYIEPKGAMSVGGARARFSYEEMAWFHEIQGFAAEIAEASSYGIIDEHEPSNIVLLSRLDRAVKLY